VIAESLDETVRLLRYRGQLPVGRNLLKRVRVQTYRRARDAAPGPQSVAQNGSCILVPSKFVEDNGLNPTRQDVGTTSLAIEDERIDFGDDVASRGPLADRTWCASHLLIPQQVSHLSPAVREGHRDSAAPPTVGLPIVQNMCAGANGLSSNYLIYN
jgi:hypothetical protein